MSDLINIKEEVKAALEVTSLKDSLDIYLEEFKSKPVDFKNPVSIKDWFLHAEIRTAGTWDEPLFCLVDIAKIIEDQNYKIFKSDSLVKVLMKDNMNRTQRYKMVDEAGLYEYLMKSCRPKAKPFQRWVLQMLVLVRRRIVTEYEAKPAHKQRKINLLRENHEDTMAFREFEYSYGIDVVQCLDLMAIFTEYMMSPFQVPERVLLDMIEEIKCDNIERACKIIQNYRASQGLKVFKKSN